VRFLSGVRCRREALSEFTLLLGTPNTEVPPPIGEFAIGDESTESVRLGGISFGRYSSEPPTDPNALAPVVPSVDDAPLKRLEGWGHAKGGEAKSQDSDPGANSSYSMMGAAALEC